MRIGKRIHKDHIRERSFQCADETKSDKIARSVSVEVNEITKQTTFNFGWESSVFDSEK